jgi:hypothetical protein
MFFAHVWNFCCIRMKNDVEKTPCKRCVCRRFCSTSCKLNLFDGVYIRNYNRTETQKIKYNGLKDNK